MGSKQYFIICLNFDGVVHYFEHERVGSIKGLYSGYKAKADREEILEEPIGYFSPDIKKAKKYIERWQAEIICSGYSGAYIKTIIQEGGC